MKIYLVCSTGKSWMSTGYGHSLLAGEADRLLVSFVEFSKDPAQQLAVKTMQFPYEPIANSNGVAPRAELLRAFGPMIDNHSDELFSEDF